MVLNRVKEIRLSKAMKTIVFVTHLYLVISCSASVYDEDDVNTLLQSDKNFFTNKPGLLTAILMEVDKRGITELPWSWVYINGTTLSHPQDMESLGKLVGRFNGRRGAAYLGSTGTWEEVRMTFINLYNTNNIGFVMADIMNNITQLKLVNYIEVDFAYLYTGLLLPPLDGDNTQRYVMMDGYYRPSTLTSTLTQFTERLKYDGDVGMIKLWKITQNEVPDAAPLDTLWRRINSLDVHLQQTRPSVVFSTSLSSGDVETPQPWRKLYLDLPIELPLSSTDRSTIDRMRENGVLGEVKKGNEWRSSLIPWLPNKQEHDW